MAIWDSVASDKTSNRAGSNLPIYLRSATKKHSTWQRRQYGTQHTQQGAHLSCIFYSTSGWTLLLAPDSRPAAK